MTNRLGRNSVLTDYLSMTCLQLQLFNNGQVGLMTLEMELSIWTCFRYHLVTLVLPPDLARSLWDRPIVTTLGALYRFDGYCCPWDFLYVSLYPCSVLDVVSDDMFPVMSCFSTPTVDPPIKARIPL